MLTVSNLTKIFRQKDKKNVVKEVGIHNISFEAKPGRILGLVGPNGAGKTTCMRILSGLTVQQKGEVLYNGVNIANIPQYKSSISLISAETQAYDRLTPREQMSIAYNLCGKDPAQEKTAIANVIEELGMQSFADTVNLSFSSGMKQKISIARGLVTDPEIIILDEATNGLDIFATRAVKDQIQRLRSLHKHVIFSTHILSDADELCDDIALLHQGSIVAIGDKKELLQQHKVHNLEELFFKLVKTETQSF